MAKRGTVVASGTQKTELMGSLAQLHANATPASRLPDQGSGTAFAPPSSGEPAPVRGPPLQRALLGRKEEALRPAGFFLEPAAAGYGRLRSPHAPRGAAGHTSPPSVVCALLGRPRSSSWALWAAMTSPVRATPATAAVSSLGGQGASSPAQKQWQIHQYTSSQNKEADRK